jgi:hypothetical protein
MVFVHLHDILVISSPIPDLAEFSQIKVIRGNVLMLKVFKIQGLGIGSPQRRRSDE